MAEEKSNSQVTEFVAGVIVVLVLLVALKMCLGGDDEPAECDSLDLECLAEAHRVDVRVICKATIEELARYEHEWTDWATFNRHAWAPGGAGRVIRFHGDELKLQNGFGAWSEHRYWCDYDVKTGELKDLYVSS